MVQTTNNQLNVALIGTGMVALTHVQSLADLSDQLTLKGVWSRRSEHTREFAVKASKLTGYRVCAYSSIESLCLDDELDFVIVLTPPNARTSIIQSLALARKHILLEKPVERTSAAAAHIVSICKEHNVTLGVVFQHRMRLASIKLSSLTNEELLGRLQIVEVIVPWWREQSYYNEPGRGSYERDGGGVLISQAIHSLDLMLSLTGPVSQVQAMASTTGLHTMEAEDYVCAGLRFASGAIGSLIASTANYPGDAESLTLHFTQAVARLQAGQLSVQWRDGRIDHYGESAATGGGADPMAFTHTWHRDIISDFANAVRNQQQPLVTGQEALQVHLLIDALITSSNQAKAIELTLS